MNEPDVLYQRMASATQVRSREIDVLAVPYDTPTELWDPTDNRVYTETIARDAFGTPARPNRIKVLRDHEITRLIGHCRSVHPNRQDGMGATFAISQTPLGDESLALAKDGSLHVSVGFTADPEGDEWSKTRDAVVRHRCQLWEISLVPFPAYDGADVLAVRRAPPQPEVRRTATPNLDQIRAWRLEEAWERGSLPSYTSVV
jgi:Escherichia/Staphylococcus phage prohead protease